MNMPNLDGTGPISGVKRGLGQGVRRNARNIQAEAGKCSCPKCGYEETHQRGIPCSQKKCPKCDTPLKGINCL